MNAAIPADVWARIAGLRPRLRSHLRWHRHYYRGHPWCVLQDTSSAQHYYFSDNARRLMDLLDGRKTLEQARSSLLKEEGAVETGEIVSLIIRLQAADLLEFEEFVDPAALFKRWQQRNAKLRLNVWLRPLSVRLPLTDPSRLLDALLPLVRPLFARLPFFSWLLIVGLALLLGLQHRAELAAHGTSHLLDPSNLLLLWLVYPLVKGLHEFGHAFAIRVWGGTVRELGIMLLVFVPIPYVDGSAATAFPDKQRRILVGAAGIMVELLLAALAFFLWLLVQPGLLRDLAFDIMLIGGVSTLLFNGNPLLRFDGYFVLADMIEIPNLATRARQYYSYLSRRYLLGMPDTPSPVVARGERSWFLLYGAASASYKVFISLVIALYVAGKFFIIGLLLALWLVVSQWLWPTLRLLRYLLSDPALVGHRPRALTLGLGFILVPMVLLLALPMPSNTVADGILRTPEQAIIRTAGSGEVIELLKGNGELVDAGERLLRLHDAELETRGRVLDARANEILARMQRASLNDRVETGILREQLEEVTEEQREVDRKLSNLIIASPTTGFVDLLKAADLPGRFVKQGQVLGVVRSNAAATARVIVRQEQAGRVRDHTLGIDLRVAGAQTQELPVTAMRAVPAGTHRLPSASLGTQGGGRIAVDVRDEHGVTAVDPVFHFDLELPPDTTAYFPGARVQVRFEHAAEPLGPRWYRMLRQLLLAHFGV